MHRATLLINNIVHYISEWSVEKKLVIWSLLFSSVLFIVPSNKVFLLVSFLFVAGLYFIWNNFTLAVLYAYIFLLPFQNGKGANFLVVPSVYVNGNVPFVMTVNFTMSNVLSVILVYIYIRNKILSQKEGRSPRVDLSDVLLSVFIIATIIASIISNIPWLSFLLTIQMCGYIFVFYFIQHHHLKQWVMKITPPLTASLCILEGLWSGLQYINKGTLGYLNPTPSDALIQTASEDISFFRMQGTFNHPNFLGFFMAFIVPVLIYYSVSRHSSNFSKISSAVGSVMGVTAMILSGSRASWVFFILGVVILSRIYLVRASMQIVPFVKRLYLSCILLFAAVIPVFIIPRIFQLVTTFNPSGGAQFRWNLLEKSLMIAFQRPLGIGLGVFPQILLEEIGGFTSAPTQPHNLIAQVLVASGFIGMISFFGFIYLKIKTRFSTLPGESDYIKTGKTACVVSLGIFLCLSMLYPILTEQQIFAWLWILISIVV